MFIVFKRKAQFIVMHGHRESALSEPQVYIWPYEKIEPFPITWILDMNLCITFPKRCSAVNHVTELFAP